MNLEVPSQNNNQPSSVEVLADFEQRREHLAPYIEELEKPGFKQSAEAKVYQRDVETFNKEWSNYGGAAIDEAQMAVDALNFKSSPEDRIAANSALTAAKDAFYENYLAQIDVSTTEQESAQEVTEPTAEATDETAIEEPSHETESTSDIQALLNDFLTEWEKEKTYKGEAIEPPVELSPQTENVEKIPVISLDTPPQNVIVQEMGHSAFASVVKYDDARDAEKMALEKGPSLKEKAKDMASRGLEKVQSTEYDGIILEKASEKLKNVKEKFIESRQNRKARREKKRALKARAKNIAAFREEQENAERLQDARKTVLDKADAKSNKVLDKALNKVNKIQETKVAKAESLTRVPISQKVSARVGLALTKFNR